jgi:hypothetical protein
MYRATPKAEARNGDWVGFGTGLVHNGLGCVWAKLKSCQPRAVQQTHIFRFIYPYISDASMQANKGTIKTMAV